MIDKVKALPEKKALAIGLTLIIGVQILLFLLSFLISIGIWTTRIIESIVFLVGVLFITSAIHKRHSGIDKGN
ncbi:MAG: hypothetical protein WAM95_17335 [Bacillus sp. (in: firmicutes)]